MVSINLLYMLSRSYAVCPEIMQCVHKLCSVSRSYAVCTEIMQCVHKLYRVFRKYTGCLESVYNLGAHLQGLNDFFFTLTGVRKLLQFKLQGFSDNSKKWNYRFIMKS